MSENNEFSFENEQYRKTYWHTCSHVMAQAVKRLYPEVKLAIGPSIDNGFYYDFDAPFNFTQEHLDAIEAEMRKICKEKLKLEPHQGQCHQADAVLWRVLARRLQAQDAAKNLRRRISQERGARRIP